MEPIARFIGSRIANKEDFLRSFCDMIGSGFGLGLGLRLELDVILALRLTAEGWLLTFIYIRDIFMVRS